MLGLCQAVDNITLARTSYPQANALIYSIFVKVFFYNGFVVIFSKIL